MILLEIMFANKNRLIEILKDSYRKLKSYINFSNGLEYVKKDIAIFESNRDAFYLTFEKLTEALINKDDSYFKTLINKIDSIPVIKSIEEKNESHIVSNVIDLNELIYIKKVNFFISLPIELRIVDCLWSLVFGSVINQESDFCYANKFEEDLYQEGSSIVDKINFKTLSLFKPYYPQYIKWQSDAIQKAIKEHETKDLTVFSLDLTRYFYSSNVDFSMIKERMIKVYKEEFNQYSYLLNLMQMIYSKYSIKLSEYDYFIEKNQICIPVGLISSYLIANFYLEEFDKSAFNSKGIIFYGRYVDDMLIVAEGIDYHDLNDLVTKKLNHIMTIKEDKVYLNNCYKVYVQPSKTILKKISKNGSVNILNNLRKEIRPSEPRLFPSYQTDMKDFLKNVSATSDSIKFRETNELSLNTKKLVSTINGYLFLKRNLYSHTQKDLKETIKKEELDEFLTLLNLPTILDINPRWNKIFLFCALHKNAKEVTQKLEKNIKIAIKNIRLRLENADNYNISKITPKLKKHLLDLLNIAKSQYIAITGLRKNKKLDSVSKLGLLFRNSLMIDFNAISIPLLAYVSIPNTMNLHLMGMVSAVDYSKKDLDIFKLKYSPRFIHIGDFMFFKQLSCISNISDFSVDFKSIVNEYETIFEDIFGKISVPLSINKRTSNSNTYHHQEFIISDNYYSNDLLNEGLYVGLANINLDNYPLVTKTKRLNLNNIFYPSNKADLTNLLNNCNLNKVAYYLYLHIKDGKLVFEERHRKYLKPVSFVVFPETYLPIWWTDIFSRYSRNTGVVIISGIKYVVYKKKVFNFQEVVIPYKDEYGHRETLVFLREKNQYAPPEKEAIIKSKCFFNDHNEPVYYTFNHRNLSFSTFICYEMTDIFARSLIRDKSDIVFASEYNKDIKYFSNIVESVSRDLSCFVVQVNSSSCGDTRIIAPYRDKFQNVASINGGERSSVHIGKIDINGLRKYLNAYYSIDKDKCNYSDLNEKDEFKIYKKPSARCRKSKEKDNT